MTVIFSICFKPDYLYIPAINSKCNEWL